MLRERIAGLYRAIVIDNNDPEGLLRIRVQIPSLLGESVSNWAWPSIPNVAGQSAPDVQSPVWVAFEDGDIDRPVWMGTWLPTRFPNAPVTPQNYILSGGINVFPTASAVAFATQTVGDAFSRFEARADGSLRWGAGTLTADTFLSRGDGGVLVQGSSPATRKLAVRGAVGQSGPLQTWEDSGTIPVAFVRYDGLIGAPYFTDKWDAGPYFAMSTTGVALADRGTPSGSLLTLGGGPARGSVLHVGSGAASTIGITVAGAVAQTGALQQWMNSVGTVLAQVTAGGAVFGQAAAFTSLQDPNAAVALLTLYTDASHGWTLASTYPAYVPFSVKGAASQTAALQEWMNSSATVLGAFTAAGAITLGSPDLVSHRGMSLANDRIRFRSPGNYHSSLRLGVDAGLTGGDNGYALTAWNENTNALAGMAASRMVTDAIWNPAGYKIADFSLNNLTIPAYLAGSIPLVVKGTAAQTGDLQQWQDSAGSVLAHVISTGQFLFENKMAVLGDVLIPSTAGMTWYAPAPTSYGIYRTSGGWNAPDYAQMRLHFETGIEMTGGSIGGKAGIRVLANSATVVPFLVQGYAGQSADLQRWQDSAGSAVAWVTWDGVVASPQFRSYYYVSPLNTGAYLHLDGNAAFILQRSAAQTALVVQGAAVQTGDLQQWRDSAANILLRVLAAGGIVAASSNHQFGTGANGGSGAFLQLGDLGDPSYIYYLSQGTGTDIGMSFRPKGAGAIIFQPPAGGVARLAIDGGGVGVGTGAFAWTQLSVLCDNVAKTGLVVRGAVAHTADLQQWQDSVGTNLAKIAINGDFTANYLHTNGGMRFGEIYGDGGMYRASGAMKFSASSFVWVNGSNGVLATLSSGGAFVATNEIRSNGSASGFATECRNFGAGYRFVFYVYDTIARIYSEAATADRFQLDSNGVLSCNMVRGNDNQGLLGGRLMTRSGANTISFAWDGTFRMYVDETNVKNFIIDHPVEPEAKYLIHTTLEGPENAVFYRGEDTLVDGQATVVLPDYFEALTQEAGRTVQVTPILNDDPTMVTNDHGLITGMMMSPENVPSLAVSRVVNGQFWVRAIGGSVCPVAAFYWEVKAVRKDVPDLLVEPNKDEVQVYGDGPYKYYSLAAA